MRKHKKTNLTKLLQPIVSAACVWALLLGLILPVAATETVSTESGDPASTVSTAEGSLPDTIRSEVAAFIETYGLTPDMPDQVLADIYTALDSEQSLAAWNKLNELLVLAEGLTQDEADALLAETNTKLCQRFYNIIVQISTPVFTLDKTFDSTNGLVDGISVHIVGSRDSASNDTGNQTDITTGSFDSVEQAVTVTAKNHTSEGSCNSIAYNKNTVTITISNTTGGRATLSFKWKTDRTTPHCTHTTNIKIANSTVDGTEATYTQLLETDGSVTVTMQSCGDKCTANSILTLSEFSITPVQDASATFVYDSTLGSITVGGNAIASGSTETVTAAGLEITATANENARFLGWVYESTGEDNGKIYSQDASTTLNLDEAATIRALFINSSASGWYLAGGTHFMNDLNKAAVFAQTAGIKSVILMNDATLPAGDYTIPAGVTLVIPFDSTNTYYVDKPKAEPFTPAVSTDPVPYPTPYRTLTMAEGAEITVNGTMSVSSKVYAGGAGGTATMPKDTYGHVVMNSGSSIIVNGALSVYGYITGSGSVTANSGAKIYEAFQVRDFRGGTATFDMAGGIEAIWNPGNEGDVFPLSQYYVQNIEVPLTIHSGASENAYIALYMQDTVIDSSVTYIGKSGCMFNLTSGYLVKQYDKTNDRLQIDIHGNVDVESFSIDIKMIMEISINSSNFILPITNNMTVNLNSGSININADMALLPGAQFNIASGTSVKLASGKRLFVYDLDEWKENNFLYPSSDVRSAYYVPNRVKDRKVDDLFDAQIHVSGTLDASEGYLYTTVSGAAITGTDNGTVKLRVDGTETVTYQVTQGGEGGTEITFVKIPITPAKLKNADGKTPAYTETASAAGTYYYSTEHGKWVKDGHTTVSETITTPATYSSAAIMTYTCACGYEYTSEIPAAKVGETTYTILSEAIAAADRKTNVTLLTNIQGDVPVNKHVTFEMGEYSAKLVAADGFDVVENEAANTATVLIEIYATNIAPGDGLDMYFYVLKSAMPDTEGYVPVITREYADDDSETKYYEWDSSYNDDRYWRFCYEGIAAKEMTDPITAVVNYSDETPATTSYTETVQHYAARTLGTADQGSELDTALIDMLNYGAGAQTYWGYNTDELANEDDITTNSKIAAYMQYATQGEIETNNNLVKGPNLKAVSVSAKNKLMLTFYFENITEDMTATYSYTNHRGEEITKTAENFVSYGNWLGVDVEGLSIADGRQLVTCTVKEGDNVIASGSDSVEGYIDRNSDNEVLKLLMKFIDSAYNYFH